MLHSENFVIELSTMVFLDCLLCVLSLLINNCCRSKELTELVPVELAFSKLANFLEKSLYKLLIFK